MKTRFFPDASYPDYSYDSFDTRFNFLITMYYYILIFMDYQYLYEISIQQKRVVYIAANVF